MRHPSSRIHITIIYPLRIFRNKCGRLCITTHSPQNVMFRPRTTSACASTCDVRCDAIAACVHFGVRFFRKERKTCRIYRCIPIVRCKGQGGTKSFLKYDLPARVVTDHVFRTCRPLSYYGPSTGSVNVSTSARSNTESDAEIYCFYRPLSP